MPAGAIKNIKQSLISNEIKDGLLKGSISSQGEIDIVAR